MEIRRLAAAEIVACQRLRYEVWSAEGVELSKPEAGSIADSHDDHAMHWGLFDGTRLVGAARLCFHKTLAEAPDSDLFNGLDIPVPVASMNRLVVATSHRGRGIAKELDQMRIRQGLEWGVRAIIVAPRVNSQSRIGSLKAQGFQFRFERRGHPVWSRTVETCACYLLLGSDGRYEPMTHSQIVPTHNQIGWTSKIPNQITCLWLDFIRESQRQPLRVLDIGAGFGVATIPALKRGARVIANDIEKSHLDAIRKEASDLGYEDQLETVVANFPADLAFTELDAIHCSNVLHFLRGEEIVAGATRMHSWLKSGGEVFIQVGTIYAGHIKRLLPQFEERRKRGVRWAGETDRAREFVLPEFRTATPEFMNYLDGSPLVEAFEAAGFQTKKAWYYTRTGLPEVFLNDGREHFGYVGRKCSEMTRETTRDVLRTASPPDLRPREITGTAFVPQTFLLRYEVWSSETILKPEVLAKGLIEDDHDLHARHWAVFDGGKIVAAARMCVHNQQEDTPDFPAFSQVRLPIPIATINRLVVHESARNLGLAMMLDKCRIEAARNDGAKCVVGTPAASRIRSLERQGFELTGERWIPHYAESLTTHAAVLMF